MAQALQLRAALDRLEGFPARARSRQRRAGGQRAGGRGQRVRTLCSRHAQRTGASPAGVCSSSDQWSPAPIASGICRSRRPRRASAKVSVRAAGQLVPERRVGVVGREHRHAGRAQRLDHRAVLARHGFHRAMNSWCSRCALLTSATWARHRGQLGNLAGWFMPSSTTPARCQVSSSGAGAAASAARRCRC
jgi:hypothetical protein